MAKKPRLTPEERYANRRASQEDYRHRVRRFTLQFSLQDTEVLEWFEKQPDKGKYLKELMLADKERQLEGQVKDPGKDNSMENNTYEIYQLKRTEKTDNLRFENLKRLQKIGEKVDKDNYDLVYHAPLDTKDTLESIYERFNLYHPADFRGHSLSVSDVVVFHKGGKDTAYYVDSYGFEEVPEFLQVQIEQLITMQTDHISVRQHFGTWYPIDQAEIDGKTYFLLEHEEYGDEAANIIIDDKGILYAQDVYDGFSEEIEDLLKLYSTPISVMPDPSVSVEDMQNYGYTFLGMVPMGAEAASELRKHSDMMVYALHPDGSESVIDNDKQFDRHAENGGMFAVDKEDWMRYLENGEYLRTTEISTEQNFNMIDGRRNNIEPKKEVKPKSEKDSVLGRLKEKQQLLISSARKEDKEKKSERDLP